MSPSQKKLLERCNLLPKRRWGQNFLIDPRVTEKILEVSNISSNDIVIEIGPGLGVLTIPLAKRALKVIAIEKDRVLAKYLWEEIHLYKNIEIIENDAMKVSYREFFKNYGRKLKVVSNLPYNISTPILFKLLREREVFESFLLMLQKEVGERIVSLPGKKTYGPLSVMVQLMTDVRIVTTIPPSAFYPRPKVYSALLYFNILDMPRIDIDDVRAFKRLVGFSFRQRRKTLKNALKPLLGNKTEAILINAGIEPMRRGETLSLSEFKRLYDAWRNGVSQTQS